MKECIVRQNKSGLYHICGYKPELYKGEHCFLLFDKEVKSTREIDDFIFRFGRKFNYFVEVKNRNHWKKRRYFREYREVYDYFYRQTISSKNRNYHVILYGKQGDGNFQIIAIR